MDEKERRMLSFQVSGEEIELIDLAAKTAGLSRSEYVRQQVLGREGSPRATADDHKTTVLLHQVLYILERLHTGSFLIAEAAGMVPPVRLKAIAEKTAADGVEWLSTIDQRIAETRKRLNDYLAAPPAAGK